MGNDKKQGTSSRRDFLSLFSLADKKKPAAEMVKMLTPDGKLVEVEKALLEKTTGKQKASNQEIYNWMKNPSKDKQ
jgi:hypothetical protein